MINNLILIGSQALHFRTPHLLKRKPADFDFICTRDAMGEFYSKFESYIGAKKIYSPSNNKIIIKGKSICEFEIPTPDSSGEKLIKMVSEDEDSLRTDFGLIPTLDILFTIKKSHRYLKNSPHFFKTFVDYHLLKNAGCKSDKFNDWLALREKETYINQKYPKLNVVKKNFFNEDSFKYTYDHDSIHVAMANNILGGSGKPAYIQYGVDGEEVKSDKKKFFECDEKIRLRGAIEEVMVLACERSLHPHKGKLTEKEAYLMAFSKLASSISSGWFREYVYENGPAIITSMPQGYSDHFENTIKNGTIIPFKEKK